MKLYTLQFGTGNGETIQALSHSEGMSALDLKTAIFNATVKARSRGVRDGEDTIRLLEEGGDDARPVWVRPLASVLR